MASERQKTKGRKRAIILPDLTEKDVAKVRGGSGTTEHDKYLENGRFKVDIPGCDRSLGGPVGARKDLFGVHMIDVPRK
jgi:hypothetical protein